MFFYGLLAMLNGYAGRVSYRLGLLTRDEGWVMPTHGSYTSYTNKQKLTQMNMWKNFAALEVASCWLKVAL
jgi:hypothetical protein